MRALTVQPGTLGSLRVEDVRIPHPARASCSCGGWRSVCATPTRRSFAATTAGLDPDKTGSCCGADPLVASSRCLRTACSAAATSSSGWCAVRTRSRAGRVRSASRKCAATVATPSAASRSCPAPAASGGPAPERYAVRVDEGLGRAGVLTEPTSDVAKAWEQVDRVGGQAWFEPRTVLVTGAGPIGLLAALLGVRRGLDVHVLDRVADGVKPDLVLGLALGATYHHTSVDRVVNRARPDVVIEATGAGSVVFDAIAATGFYGIVCLTGVSLRGRDLTADGNGLDRSLVMENNAVIGSVNANLRHYQAAAEALADADRDWLRRLLTTTVPLDEAASAFDRPGEDVKVVVTLEDGVV